MEKKQLNMKVRMAEEITQMIKLDVTLETLASIDSVSAMAGFEAEKRANVLEEARKTYDNYLDYKFQGADVYIINGNKLNYFMGNLDRRVKVRMRQLKPGVQRLQFYATKKTLEQIDNVVKRGGHKDRAEMLSEALKAYASFLMAYLSGGEVKITIGEESIDITKDIESLRNAKERTKQGN